MSDEDPVASREAMVRRTLAEFCHLTDAGDFDQWVELFTEDGSFHLLGQVHTGRDELRAFIELDQAPESRGIHLTTDSVITFTGDVAEVCSKFVFIGAGESAGVVVAAGTYEDVLVPDGSRWRFRRRECSLYAAPATQAWGAQGARSRASAGSTAEPRD